MSLFNDDDEELDEDYEDDDEDQDEDEESEEDRAYRQAQLLRIQRRNELRGKLWHPEREQQAPIAVMEQPYGRHAKPDHLPQHARCSICELSSQAHPHPLCELTPEQVAATQAEPDAIRKHHLAQQRDRDEQINRMRRRR